MSDLKQLQQDFLQNVMERKQALSGQAGTTIYQNNYLMGLIKSLVVTFPVCEQLVGENFFKTLAKHYIFDNPSEYASLNDYGNAFPAFLQDFPAVKDLDYLSYLSFVAELEWAISRVEIGVAEHFFDWGLLASIPADKQPDLILHRRQNAKLLYAPYPIDRIWQTNQPGFVGDDIVNLAEGEVYLFIYRVGYDNNDNDIRIDRLSSLDWEILNKIDGKTSLADLWTKFENNNESENLSDSENENQIEARLPFYIKRGYISRFSLPT